MGRAESRTEPQVPPGAAAEGRSSPCVLPGAQSAGRCRGALGHGSMTPACICRCPCGKHRPNHPSRDRASSSRLPETDTCVPRGWKVRDLTGNMQKSQAASFRTQTYTRISHSFPERCLLPGGRPSTAQRKKPRLPGKLRRVAGTAPPASAGCTGCIPC